MTMKMPVKTVFLLSYCVIILVISQNLIIQDRNSTRLKFENKNLTENNVEDKFS